MRELTQEEKKSGKTKNAYEVPVKKFYTVTDPDIKKAIVNKVRRPFNKGRKVKKSAKGKKGKRMVDTKKVSNM